MGAAEALRLQALEDENGLLRRLVTDLSLQIQILKEAKEMLRQIVQFSEKHPR